MTFESHNPETGELVGTSRDHDEAEHISTFNLFGTGGDAIRFSGRILTRTLLSIALILGFALLLALAILRVACSSFEK